MDREHAEMKNFGICQILEESIRVIFTRGKIFSQITLTLILPLSIVYLAHGLIHNMISSKWWVFPLFKLAFFTILLAPYLLSTAAVVYTVACIYAAKPVTFRTVIGAAPKVWKRLMVTLLWSFGVLFVYEILVSLGVFYLLSLGLKVPGEGDAVVAIEVVGAVLMVVFFFGFAYITLIWNLASVVTLLEDDLNGIRAMAKSHELMKGKRIVAGTMYSIFTFEFVGVNWIYEKVVVGDDFLSNSFMAAKIGTGIFCFLFLVFLNLLGLVLQTVLYFVCKSSHHQTIDKPSLASQLEGYLLLKSNKDIQLSPLQV